MALIDLHIHIHGQVESQKLDTIITQNNQIMAKIDELNEKIQTLENTVNEEQQEISNALAALALEVQTLKDIIAAGGTATEEQLQAAITKIDSIIEDVKTSIPNLPDPEPPAQG